jgi:CHAT domain
MSTIEVAIGPGAASGTFQVQIVQSPAGEASVVVNVDVGTLLARRVELQHAVLASAVATRRVLGGAEQCLREVGQTLFRALLGSGEVAGQYRASAVVAAERAQGLRVVLRIEDPMLACLPWEAMYDDALGSYVCRREQLVRHVPVPSLAAPLAVRSSLRILGVIASPRGLAALDTDREKSQLTYALGHLSSQGLADVHWAPSATWADLQDLLQADEWHVVHFIGHGDFDASRDEGVLALVTEDGRADLVEASRLVDLLRQAHPMPRLVVLNSCAGAATGVEDLFAGTAAALVRGGVSAVAAMQYAISDPAAVAFARGFYGAIAHGRGVDEAVSSGRVAILGTSRQTLEWVTPVLYLRGHDSHLFTLSEVGAHGRSERHPDRFPPPLRAAASGPADTKAGRPPIPEPRGMSAMSGDGVYVVGLDIKPGVYRTAGPAGGGRGYYALLSSTNTNDIIENGNVAGPATITVGPGVKAVSLSGWQPWYWHGDDLDAVLRQRQSNAGGT